MLLFLADLDCFRWLNTIKVRIGRGALWPNFIYPIPISWNGVLVAGEGDPTARTWLNQNESRTRNNMSQRT